MDIYTNNIIFYGTIITKEQCNDLINILGNYSDAENIIDIYVYRSVCIRKICGKHLLFVTTSYYNFRNNKTIITSEDTKRGYINLSNIEKNLWLNNISRVQIILYPDKEDIERLNAITSLLTFCDDSKLIPRLELIEILNNDKNISSGLITCILPII